MRALIVDDSETMRIVVAQYLLEIGLTGLDEAGDGLQALRLLRENEYDCVFLDLNLPLLDGVALLRAVRAEGNAVPVIVVTTERCRVVEAVRAGANEYVLKPFDKEMLARKVKAVLGSELSPLRSTAQQALRV
ncbi:MAG: response regulator [Deltaproteobacteria bacterium]|nr:response regulator [Deltaproteobacteria bacterium]